MDIRKKIIAIFTTTRAEFGLLSALIGEINNSDKLESILFVGGAHLAVETGKTICEINEAGFKITATFDYLLNSDSELSVSKSLGIAVLELSRIFNEFQFDMVCVLGDRYELMAIVSNAIIFRKPIIHIHGGEKTEGAIDEQIRHMITKAAHIHFASCEEYAQNIIKMGEAQWRVFNTGALTIDNILTIKRKTRSDLFTDLKLDEKKDTVLLTYHPVTLEMNISSLKQITNIFEALNNYGFQVVVTAPNFDNDREQIIEFIMNQVKQNKNYHYFDNLGFMNYLNLIPECKFVIGNSSSGIIEVPYFKIPTINIGDRQKGRIMHESIINTTDYSIDSICSAINKATDHSFNAGLQTMLYKFGNGTAADKMVDILTKLTIDSKLLQKQLIFPD
jgi:GDP/UDP-N,N'-diacetylbacillosamine 2-epimerase (hydrolysing)